MMLMLMVIVIFTDGGRDGDGHTCGFIMHHVIAEAEVPEGKPQCSIASGFCASCSSH